MHNYTKYFKETQGFERLLDKIYQKYQSLSKFSGTIKLENLTKEEATTFSIFFGTTYKEHENMTIQVKKIERIMQNSKYEDFDFKILLQEYLNKSLVTNNEQKENKNKIEQEYYSQILKESTSIGKNWLENVLTTKKEPYKLLQQRYHKNSKLLKRTLLNTIEMINNLPKEKTPLPIFASTYTKDPHYLDLDNNKNIFFFYALSHLDKSPFPKTRQDKVQLLSKYNIEIDTLSNYVLTYNLLSEKHSINDFSKNKETLILNIQNIMKTNTFDTKEKKIYIFENPSILTEVLRKDLSKSIIIAGGFPNLSIYLLLDKLVEKQNHIYYNGDFDPEGLLIAQKLKDKYKDKLDFFCYAQEDYNACISKEPISPLRLKKLSKITDESLIEIKELLLNIRYSAYQENNKERIINWIQNNN